MPLLSWNDSGGAGQSAGVVCATFEQSLRVVHCENSGDELVSRDRIQTNVQKLRRSLRHDVGTMTTAINDAAHLELNEEPMTTTELARLLSHRLQTDENTPKSID